ncbi:MAG: hypothetical protein WCX83_01025, partial [Candidatus Cloacimonas sp.]|nr:hypothetical protein [Candidatus Cloacimonadota bacterium]
YQATDTNYFIESIEIQGNKEYRSDKIELSLYDGASLLYRTNELSINNDSTIFQLPEIPLTNSLFLTVKNVDDKPLSIYRENLTHLQVTSNRTYIYYSEWQPLQGKDLAVKLLLRKR